MSLMEVWAYGICAVTLLVLLWMGVERRLCRHEGCEAHEICPVCGRRKD